MKRTLRCRLLHWAYPNHALGPRCPDHSSGGISGIMDDIIGVIGATLGLEDMLYYFAGLDPMIHSRKWVAMDRPLTFEWWEDVTGLPPTISGPHDRREHPEKSGYATQVLDEQSRALARVTDV